MVEPVHQLSMYPDIDARFPDRVDELLVRLRSLVGSVAIRQTFDQSVIRLCHQSLVDERYKTIVPLLIAHVGELIREKRGGCWQMRLGWDGRTYEPWVVTADGVAVIPFKVLDFVEWEPEDWSLEGAIEVILRYPPTEADADVSPNEIPRGRMQDLGSGWWCYPPQNQQESDEKL